MATIKEQLVLHEGNRSRPYTDIKGKITIGIGHNLMDQDLPRGIIDQLFDIDLAIAALTARKFADFDKLNYVRRKVLIDMAFNLGPGLLMFTKTRGFVAAEEYDLAADAMMDSLWAPQVGPRAPRLAQMMRTGKDYDEVP
jgi:lysozyme